MKLQLLVAVFAAITLTACADEAPEPVSDVTQPATPQPAPSPVQTAAAPSPTASSPSPSPVADVACAPVERPALQSGEHLIGDQEPPVPYNSTPPTSGWHASGAFTIDVQPPDDPLPEPRQVSVLEAGGVVVAYRDLPDEDRTRLEDHVRAHHEGRVAVTAYDQLDPGEVAFTAWGTLQRCDGVDLEALDAFVAEHAEDEVHTPGTHGH